MSIDDASWSAVSLLALATKERSYFLFRTLSNRDGISHRLDKRARREKKNSTAPKIVSFSAPVLPNFSCRPPAMSPFLASFSSHRATSTNAPPFGPGPSPENIIILEFRPLSLLIARIIAASKRATRERQDKTTRPTQSPFATHKGDAWGFCHLLVALAVRPSLVRPAPSLWQWWWWWWWELQQDCEGDRIKGRNQPATCSILPAKVPLGVCRLQCDRTLPPPPPPR